MLDTGAAISLISDFMWQTVNNGKLSLASWDGHKLVGVEGSAIPVLGVTTSSINFTGIDVSGDFVVARELSSDAILELDFFECNCCCINTEQRTLHLKGRALCLTRDSDSTLRV